jgi:hypothetical protein
MASLSFVVVAWLRRFLYAPKPWLADPRKHEAQRGLSCYRIAGPLLDRAAGQDLTRGGCPQRAPG